MPKDKKPFGYKWVLKTKQDSKDNVKRYKARLVEKGFTQRKGIDHKKTFSLIFMKDFFKITMVLLTHFDLELHQMDVKTVFLNGDIEEEIYMVQPDSFEVKGLQYLICKLKKFIYGLKQASHQWYLKFDQVIFDFDFKKNIVDQYIYHKFKESKLIFLVLYVDDILLASSFT